MISSTTVLTEVLMNTLMIDTLEGRDIEIFDASSAYMHEEMTKENKFIIKI